MYPKTFEEFFNSKYYEGFVKYSLMRVNVPIELREDFTQEVYEYLLSKKTVERFNPDFRIKSNSAPIHKLGKKVTFSGYIYQYILYLWWKKANKFNKDILGNAVSLQVDLEGDEKGCVLINSFEHKNEDVDFNIMVDQFKSYMVRLVEHKKAQGYKPCKRDRNIVKCFEMLIEGYTLQEIGDTFGVTHSAVNNWKNYISDLMLRYQLVTTL